MGVRFEKLKQKYLNQRFTNLLVIDLIFVDNKNKAKCLCDCGKITLKNLGDLSSGDTKSCGCLRIKSTIERCKSNLLNLKFGKLTVIEYMGSCNQGSLWKCLCECGNLHNVATVFLNNGSSKSCGCINKSTGKDHYNFKDTILEEDRINKRGTVKNPRYEQWKKDCLIRDSYTCQLSNQIGGKLSVHHIYSWNKYIDLRFNINNGITLSKNIHNNFHKIYGKGDNTLNQFIEYLQNQFKDINPSQLLNRSILECKSCEG